MELHWEEMILDGKDVWVEVDNQGNPHSAQGKLRVKFNPGVNQKAYSYKVEKSNYSILDQLQIYFLDLLFLID